MPKNYTHKDNKLQNHHETTLMPQNSELLFLFVVDFTLEIVT